MSNIQRYDIELHNNENGKIGKFTLLYDKSLFSQDDIKAFVKQRQEIYTNYKDMLLYLMVTKNIICIPTEQVPLLDKFIQEKAEILKEENNKEDMEL